MLSKPIIQEAALSAHEILLRPARKEDAPVLVDIIDFASKGIVFHVWSTMAEPGESPREVGLRRAAREEGGFSYRNFMVAELDGQALAGMLGYRLAEEPEPYNPEEMLPMLRPLAELEALVPGTWYINVLASYPEQRGKGLGAALIGDAKQRALASGAESLSLIVADANAPARRFYERMGFREVASRPMIKDAVDFEGSAWLLLVCGLA